MDMDEKKLAELMAVTKEKLKHGQTKEQHFAEMWLTGLGTTRR